LLVCGRCGQRLLVSDSGRARRLRYPCGRAAVAYAAPLCQGRAGRPLDDLVAAPVRAALEPAALQLSLAAAADLHQERARLHRLRQQDQERAPYAAERARRQDDAVAPANRWVARELERRGEETLKEPRRLAAAYARGCRSQPAGLSAAAREQSGSLAQDLPALWPAPGTTAADRQRLVRLLVEEVLVTVRGARARVDVTIRWAGGPTTGHAVVRPVRRYEQLADYGRLLSRIAELRQSGLTLAEGAVRLNAEGFRPPKRSPTFTSAIGTRLRAMGSRSGPRPLALADGQLRGAHAWLLSALARHLGMPQATLHRWIRAGWVRARKLPTPGGHWAIWADAGELDRMARLRTCPRGWSDEPVLAELTKPKARDNN